MVSPRGIFESVAVLIEAIDEYIVHNNENPQVLHLDQDRRGDHRQSLPRQSGLEAVRQSRVIQRSHH